MGRQDRTDLSECLTAFNDDKNASMDNRRSKVRSKRWKNIGIGSTEISTFDIKYDVDPSDVRLSQL
jgi:hypothetical protein